MARPPLHVLWIIAHICYDGSLHGGDRLFMNLTPEFDSRRVKVYPYFLRASVEVKEAFADARVKSEILAKGMYDPTTLLDFVRLCRVHNIDVMHLFCYASSTFGRVASWLTHTPAIIHDFDTQICFPYPFYRKLLDRILAGRTSRALAVSPLCQE